MKAISRLDPLNCLLWLRENGLLEVPYFLHIHSAGADIGWNVLSRFSLPSGKAGIPNDWIPTVEKLANEAALDNNKAFGYVSFDACDSVRGVAPDGSIEFPLVQFFIPEHRLRIRNENVEYFGPSSFLLDQLVSAAPIARKPLMPVAKAVSGNSEDQFLAMVERATSQFIGKSDKLVLSRFLGFDYKAEVLDLFSAYCEGQIVSDAILFNFGDAAAAIASPELLIDVNGGIISANPLAGTSLRGKSHAEEATIKEELLGDRKILAEHVLAVMQMLNELAPHCEADTLVLNKLLEIAEQGHVFHLSSEIRARLNSKSRALQAMLSLFPSTMVSGIPKPGAIRLIRQLEPFQRGIYGGAVGWVSGRDECRFALAIRGMFQYGARLFVQAGAGIMQESDPLSESLEVTAKMSAMLNVLQHNTRMEAKA